MSIENLTVIEGDAAVHRNVAMGGSAKVRGSMKIGHNLIVEGWVLADNVKWPNVGLFDSVEALSDKYGRGEGAIAEPKEGWTAGVVRNGMVKLYYYRNGMWTATGLSMSEYTGGDMTGYVTAAYLEEKLEEKADVTEMEEKADVSYVDECLSQKADAEDVYRKDEVYDREYLDNVHENIIEAIEAAAERGGVKRMTYTVFHRLTEKDKSTIYAVTTNIGDELRYLYLGDTLIAKKADGGGSQGFPYTFPIVFGR